MTTSSNNASGAGACEMKPEDFAFLRTLPGNTECIDCGAPKPDWGSPKMGILFCFQCSGAHRGLGTHISFVRSVMMDAWTEQQMALMKAGGNRQCLDFLASHGLPARKRSIREKYTSPTAELYRQVLLARVEGRPEPLALPEAIEQCLTPTLTTATSSSSCDGTNKPKVDPSKIQGFGSSPPPSSSMPRSQSMKKCLWVTVTVVLGAAVWLVVPH